ncbi:hypothetical protein [Sphingomonas sp. 22176]
MLDSTNVTAQRSAAGGNWGACETFGISRGGYNTKIHAIADAQASRSPSF